MTYEFSDEYRKKMLENLTESINDTLIENSLSPHDVVATIKDAIVDTFNYYDAETTRLDCIHRLLFGSSLLGKEEVVNDTIVHQDFFDNIAWTEYYATLDKQEEERDYAEEYLNVEFDL